MPIGAVGIGHRVHVNRSHRPVAPTDYDDAFMLLLRDNGIAP